MATKVVESIIVMSDSHPDLEVFLSVNNEITIQELGADDPYSIFLQFSLEDWNEIKSFIDQQTTNL